MNSLSVAVYSLAIDALDRLPGRRWPKHPIDEKLGIETSKKIPRLFQSSGRDELDDKAVASVGVQPSIIRKALTYLDVGADDVFIDLGCGRGRALIVAAEFPFRSLVGYELYPFIAGVGRKNVAKVKLSQRVKIVESDASRPALPSEGKAVVFLYNPFQKEIVARLITHLEEHLRRTGSLCKLWIVYVNPVCFDQFDGCDLLRRYAAERVYYYDDERKCCPFHQTYDSFIIYQSAPFQPPLAGADAAVKITIPNFGADVMPA